MGLSRVVDAVEQRSHGRARQTAERWHFGRVWYAKSGLSTDAWVPLGYFRHTCNWSRIEPSDGNRSAVREAPPFKTTDPTSSPRMYG